MERIPQEIRDELRKELTNLRENLNTDGMLSVYKSIEEGSENGDIYQTLQAKLQELEDDGNLTNKYIEGLTDTTARKILLVVVRRLLDRVTLKHIHYGEAYDYIQKHNPSLDYADKALMGQSLNSIRAEVKTYEELYTSILNMG